LRQLLESIVTIRRKIDERCLRRKSVEAACRTSPDVRQSTSPSYQSALPTEKVAVDKNSGVICTPV